MLDRHDVITALAATACRADTVMNPTTCASSPSTCTDLLRASVLLMQATPTRYSNTSICTTGTWGYCVTSSKASEHTQSADSCPLTAMVKHPEGLAAGPWQSWTKDCMRCPGSRVSGCLPTLHISATLQTSQQQSIKLYNRYERVVQRYTQKLILICHQHTALSSTQTIHNDHHAHKVNIVTML